MSTAELLKSVPLFSGLSEQYVSAIEKLSRERSFAPGEEIVAEDDEGGGLYVIVAGRVVVVKDSDDGEVELGRMGPGEVFGELALLTNRPRIATVRAVEPTACIIILSVTFQKMLDHSPEVSKSLSRTLALRLAEIESRVGSR